MIRTFSLGDFVYLLEAARWTLGLTVIAALGGGLIGLGVAFMRIARWRALRLMASLYIQVIQGTPLLILLFLFYFGLDIIGLRLPAIVAAALGLVLYSSSFLAEIWRGCLEAIPRAQWEAAEALALTSWQRMRHVILPQAIRIAIPPTVGFLVQIVKNTSLTAIIGFVELSRAGQLVNNATFQPFAVFLTVAAIYFVICFPLSAASQRLERKMHVAGR
jgi:polar amino acid transport system permease protein